MLAGIDHVVVVTTDLDASRDELADLGFTVTPKARHPLYGTANHLCVFAEAAYLEILGVEHEHPDQPTTQQFLAPSLTAGGGVAAFALATDDATALHASLAATGIECTVPSTWTRDADTPSGVCDATFTTFFFRPVPPPASPRCSLASSTRPRRYGCPSGWGTPTGLEDCRGCPDISR